MACGSSKGKMHNFSDSDDEFNSHCDIREDFFSNSSSSKRKDRDNFFTSDTDLEDEPIDKFRLKWKKKPRRGIIHSDSDFDDFSSDGDDYDNKSGDDVCPICLGEFENQLVGVPENCEHTFCIDCIQEWSKNVNNCPVDRKKFNLIRIKNNDGAIIQEVVVKDVDKYEDPPTYCQLCNQCDREDCMLLCDECDNGYHIDCLNPPLEHVPIENWFCVVCAPPPAATKKTKGKEKEKGKYKVKAEWDDFIDDSGYYDDHENRNQSGNTRNSRVPRGSRGRARTVASNRITIQRQNERAWRRLTGQTVREEKHNSKQKRRRKGNDERDYGGSSSGKSKKSRASRPLIPSGPSDQKKDNPSVSDTKKNSKSSHEHKLKSKENTDNVSYSKMTEVGTKKSLDDYSRKEKKDSKSSKSKDIKDNVSSNSKDTCEKDVRHLDEKEKEDSSIEFMKSVLRIIQDLKRRREERGSLINTEKEVKKDDMFRFKESKDQNTEDKNKLVYRMKKRKKGKKVKAEEIGQEVKAVKAANAVDIIKTYAIYKGVASFKIPKKTKVKENELSENKWKDDGKRISPQSECGTTSLRDTDGKDPDGTAEPDVANVDILSNFFVKNTCEEKYSSYSVNKSYSVKSIYNTCKELQKDGKVAKVWFYSGVVHFKLTDNQNEYPKKIFHMDDIKKYIDVDID